MKFASAGRISVYSSGFSQNEVKSISEKFKPIIAYKNTSGIKGYIHIIALFSLFH